jgi:hypothetical protein
MPRLNAAGWTAVTGASQAAWTALAVPLNAWFVSALGVLYDPQDDEQRRDALAGAAAAVYTAGVHLGHGACVFLGLVLATHPRRSWTVAALAGAGVALCQLAAAVPLGVAQLTALNVEHHLRVPDPTLRAAPGVLVPVAVCALLYPVASLLGNRIGARYGVKVRQQWPALLGGAILWLLMGPFYLTLIGPAFELKVGVFILLVYPLASLLVLFLALIALLRPKATRPAPR